jgi:RimJ/RimL family protein N-acetyltransferase
LLYEPAGVEIAGPRLRLREPRRSDLDALHEAICETLPELVRWLPWARESHSRADTRRYLRGARIARAHRTAFEFIVEDATGSQLLGVTSVHRIDWVRHSAGLGYWIRRSCQGKGTATEAARLLADYAFRTLRLHRLEAHVALDNPASQRVVERAGFRREGVARENELIGGRFIDHVQYGLLAPDVLGRESERP